MLRILLFLGTNLAILVVLNIVMALFGLDRLGGMSTQGMLLSAAVMGMTGSIISLMMSKWMAKRSVGAQVIEHPRSSAEKWLVDTVAKQARAAGIGMPEVAIYHSPDLNAFATGANRNNALVAVSTGLLERMTSDEVEAVLAHEISHVANGDMVTLSLIQGVVNTFVIFLSNIIGQLVDRTLFRRDDDEGPSYGPGYYITSMIAQMVLGILASMIVMWFSRYREFRADAGGATLSTRSKMIAALERLRQAHSPSELPDEMNAFGISSGARGGFSKLFMTHPPLEERIAALHRAKE